MEALKKLVNRKIIAVAMIVYAVMTLVSVLSRTTAVLVYDSWLALFWCIIKLIMVAGTVILVFCVLKNKKDNLLLIGVGIMLVAQILYLFYNISYYTILPTIGWVIIAVLAIKMIMPEKVSALGNMDVFTDPLGMVAAVMIFAPEVIDYVTYWRLLVDYEYATAAGMLSSYVTGIINIVAVTLGYGLFALYISMLAQGKEIPEKGFEKAAYGTTTESMKMSLGVHVLLLLITCGIWLYIWIYKATAYLNKGTTEKRNPVTKLLLCMFIPFYYIYWVYKSAQIIDSMCKEKGKSSDIATMCLILAIFVNIVPPIIMQDKINSLDSIDEAHTETKTNQTATDELREYKKLLDEGVISEEEFETKKKQIIGL